MLAAWSLNLYAWGLMLAAWCLTSLALEACCLRLEARIRRTLASSRRRCVANGLILLIPRDSVKFWVFKNVCHASVYHIQYF